MKIAANYCVYNEANYIGYSLQSIYPFVDKIIILISDGPWKGQSGPKDRTSEIITKFPDSEKKIVSHRGRWRNQTEERNYALRMSRDLGMDFYWVVDADEIYDERVAHFLTGEILRYPEIVNFYCGWWTYWRSFYYRIEPPETSTFVIGRITPAFQFIHARQPEKGTSCSLDCFLHHYSYARPFERIKRKMTNITGPGSPVLPGWFEKFKNWPQNKNIGDLHPYWPGHWKKAIKITWEIPEILKSHPWSRKEIIE